MIFVFYLKAVLKFVTYCSSKFKTKEGRVHSCGNKYIRMIMKLYYYLSHTNAEMRNLNPIIIIIIVIRLGASLTNRSRRGAGCFLRMNVVRRWTEEIHNYAQ